MAKPNPGKSSTKTRHFSLASLRSRVVLLVLLALLPALGLQLYTAAEQRRLAAERVKSNALQLVQSVAANQTQLIEGVNQLLVVLSELPAVREGEAAECNALAANLLKRYPRYANLGVIDPQGNAWCSGLPISKPVNSSDRLYFRQALEQRRFSVGQYQIGRVTRKATINFGYPVLDANQEPRSVVFAALDLAWVNQLASQVQLPPEVAMIIFDREGTILARHPDPENWIGKSAATAPIVRAALQQVESGTAETAGIDGVVRLYAFTPLNPDIQGKAVYLSIGIPRDVAFADVDRLTLQNLTGLILVAALVFTVAWIGSDVFLLRQLQALLQAIHRLKDGNLSARTHLSYGSGELGQLAWAFDEMAERLEAHEQKLQQTMTALAQTTIDLERRNQELDQFAYVVSHDLKAPLRAIVNLSEWIEEDLDSELTPDTRHQLDLLRRRVHRMGNLIDGILQYSRVGRVSTHPSLVAVPSLLATIIDSLAPPALFKIEIGDGMPTFMTEEVPLQQVFSNLISNALKYHDREDGQIWISVVEQTEFYEFAVADDGPGIEPQYHEKIFGIFQTLEARDKVESTGIGLSVVKKIIESKGGSIHVESQAGEGATFYFTWPKSAT